MEVPSEGFQPASEAFTLGVLFGILRTRWKECVVPALAAGVIAVGVAMLVPKTYTTQTVVIPTGGGGSSPASLLGSLSASVPVGLLGGAGADPSRVMVIMNSLSLRDSLVAKLRAADPAMPEHELREVVTDRMEVARTLEGAITVRVSDGDPARAALIANTVPPVVNEIAVRMATAETRERQRFLEGQIEEARAALVQTEQRLVSYQQEQEIPEVREQARVVLEAAAGLQRQIMQKEVEVSQLRRTATAENPALRSATAELASLRQQLRELTSGGGRDSGPFLSLRESPELQVGAGRLLREFTEREQIYGALAASLADTRLRAENSLPVVTVLDRAYEPLKPSSPKLPQVFALALILGALLGIGRVIYQGWRSLARAHGA